MQYEIIQRFPYECEEVQFTGSREEVVEYWHKNVPPTRWDGKYMYIRTEPKVWDSLREFMREVCDES